MPPRGFCPLNTTSESCQIVEALAFLHGRDIAHGDIKAANALVTVEGIIKLVDFGCTRTEGNTISASPITTLNESTTIVGTAIQGTVLWMAPEVANGSPGTLWPAST